MRFFRPLLLAFIIAPLAEAETRVFVSLAWTLLEAEITAVAGENVTLKRKSDSQSQVVHRKNFCKEDNAYITRWMEQHAEPAPSPAAATAATATPLPLAGISVPPAQKYRLTCQTLPSKSNRSSRDSELRVFEYVYNFNISNQEVSRDLQNARGMVIILAKGSSESTGDLIVLQREEFDVTVRAQSKTVFATPPVRLTYTVGTDAKDTGVKSYGYVLIIRDAAGSLLHVEASPDTSAKYLKEILALALVPCVVDREFKLKPNVPVPTSYISF